MPERDDDDDDICVRFNIYIAVHKTLKVLCSEFIFYLAHCKCRAREIYLMLVCLCHIMGNPQFHSEFFNFFTFFLK
jgi:hypothetical protein